MHFLSLTLNGWVGCKTKLPPWGLIIRIWI